MYVKWVIFLFLLSVGKVQSHLLEELTLEEKVGQLLIVHFHGQELNADAKKLIQEAHVGGFIYYQWANDLSDPTKVQALSASLQEAARQKTRPIPLWIAVDQEGGTVNRLTKGVTIFPSNYAIGQTKRPEWAEEVAYAIGEELCALGINMNLAPVVDVHSNPLNPVIGMRAFSSHPEEVVRFGAKALVGYQRAGILSVLKHFPGHGDVKEDSHKTLPLVSKSLVELEKTELLPFKELASQASIIMTAHLLVPALDPHTCITFSSHAVEGYLRKQLKFEGLVMTDSLVMQGLIQQTSSIEEAALRSLQAGHDLLLLGGKQLHHQQTGFELSCEDIVRLHHFLVEAVQRGDLPLERLNESVKRILALKEAYRLGEQKETNFSLAEHQELAYKIVQAAYDHHFLALSPQEFRRMGLQIWQNECAGKQEGLTSWNQGEEFASLGIGHFIWYPSGVQGPFKETFPSLLNFFVKEGVALPESLKASGCPWRSREEFLKAQNHPLMRELRQFLADHIDVQIAFMVERLYQAFPALLKNAPAAEKNHVATQFYRLAHTSHGLYVLLDYLNFKGEGLSPLESYQGQGWGLLQVLMSMQGTVGGQAAIQEFIEAAKGVLTRRVQYAPLKRHEERWLKGWCNRLDSYKNFSINS